MNDKEVLELDKTCDANHFFIKTEDQRKILILTVHAHHNTQFGLSAVLLLEKKGIEQVLFKLSYALVV
jgi:hypothetical protein